MAPRNVTTLLCPTQVVGWRCLIYREGGIYLTMWLAQKAHTCTMHASLPARKVGVQTLSCKPLWIYCTRPRLNKESFLRWKRTKQFNALIRLTSKCNRHQCTTNITTGQMVSTCSKKVSQEQQTCTNVLHARRRTRHRDLSTASSKVDHVSSYFVMLQPAKGFLSWGPQVYMYFITRRSCFQARGRKATRIGAHSIIYQKVTWLVLARYMYIGQVKVNRAHEVLATID